MRLIRNAVRSNSAGLPRVGTIVNRKQGSNKPNEETPKMEYVKVNAKTGKFI